MCFENIYIFLLTKAALFDQKHSKTPMLSNITILQYFLNGSSQFF